MKNIDSVKEHREFTENKLICMDKEKAIKLLKTEIEDGKEIGIHKDLIEEHERILKTYL